MPSTLRSLLADRTLGLRVLAGGRPGNGLDQPVTWVHVSELDDPTPFLAGGELLLTTGLGIGASTDFGEFVGRLAASEVAGLGFGTGLSHEEVPAGLVAAAGAAHLPLIEVPRRTPFIAISKALSAALAQAAYAEVTRTNAAQHALTRAAVDGQGALGVVRRLSKLLGAWVLLLDGGGRTVCAAPATAARRLPALTAEIDRLRAKGGPASSTFALDGALVSAQVLGGRGYLVIGRATGLVGADQHIASSAAAMLTLLRTRSVATQRADRQLRSGLLRLLLDGQAEVAREPVRQLWGPLPDAPVRVHALTGDAEAQRGAADLLAARAGGTAGATFYGQADDTLLVLATPAEASAELARRLPDLRIGVSDPVGYDRLDEARRQALRAAEAGRRAGAPRTLFADLGGQSLLRLLDSADAEMFAAAVLAPLIRHDAHGRGELVGSLAEWLRQHGQWQPAAARLAVHRHTLRHRIKQVESLLGRDLDSAGTRAELWLALQLTGRA